MAVRMKKLIVFIGILLGINASAQVQPYPPSSNATQVNGATIPASQTCLGSNASSQIIPGTCGGSPAFNTIGNGTNTNTLVIGSGGSLGISGTGTIAANTVPGTLAFTGSTLTFTTSTNPSWISSATNTLAGESEASVTPQIYSFQNNYDQVDTTTAGTSNLDEVFIRDVPGTGHTGGRSSLWVEMDINGVPGIAAGINGYVGVQSQVTDNVSLGGTDSNLNAAGNVFGFDSNTSLQSGATNVAVVTGLEIGSSIATGASSRARFGIDITAGGQIQGTDDDAALAIHGIATAPWQYLIEFGGAVTGWPSCATCTLIGATARSVGGSSSPVALNGIDFSAVGFQSGGCAFKSASASNASGGFCVDQNGRFEPQTTSAHSWTTTGLFASVPGGLTLTDTTSTGTVAVEATVSLGGETYNSTNVTTFTQLATLFVSPPSASGNATCTTCDAIYATGQIITTSDLASQAGLFVTGGTVALNRNNANPVDICDQTGCSSAVTIGNSSHTGNTILAGLSSDVTHTDASVCEDTTTHALYFGSGTIGICLGTSSARYKHDMTALNAGVQTIVALNPISYKVNSDHGDPNKILYGFTAEEMYKVVPDLVDLDADGKPNTADYVGLIPVLVKAIQQQQREIDDLKRPLKRHH
jgi:Chaperone of endosialidase